MVAARAGGLLVTPFCCRGCARFGLKLTLLLRSFVVPHQS
jgi:hypothetical protein